MEEKEREEITSVLQEISLISTEMANIHGSLVHISLKLIELSKIPQENSRHDGI